MPEADGFPSAVVISGGKQYRVTPGDRLLVDRLGLDAGAELSLDRVLMIADGDDLKVGSALAGATVLARVVDHRRGPKIRVLRYKSKKRVRVHKGARADLTLLEIVEVAGRRAPAPEKAPVEKPRTRRGRLGRRAPEPEAPPVEETAAELEVAEAAERPARAPARRRPGKAAGQARVAEPHVEEGGDGA